jgi:hypothetical protein
MFNAVVDAPAELDGRRPKSVHPPSVERANADPQFIRRLGSVYESVEDSTVTVRHSVNSLPTVGVANKFAVIGRQ